MGLAGGTMEIFWLTSLIVPPTAPTTYPTKSLKSLPQAVGPAPTAYPTKSSAQHPRLTDHAFLGIIKGMANIEISQLEAAYKDGIFSKKLSKNQEAYMRPSILSAWQILELVQLSKKGILISSICDLVGQNTNTVRHYTRWLRSKKLIEAYYEGSRLVLIPPESTKKS